MDLHLLIQADSTLCRVTGDVDISCSPELRERLLAALQPPRPRLEVDLSGVTFMDASGVAALMAARRRSLRLGGGVCLISPSSSVLRVLEASGLSARFPVRRKRVPAETLDAVRTAQAAFRH
ncbi:anti-sigma factor antagonist [Sphaerisporangium krabiense]|uniref:Anti-sigma factor antagonist n=1 Tax=Sphaerisporangium krabiense TaxID=763782 RepID=A0A7W8Z7J0_9ACTN|nr:STAS domain-containing protein [Sphaerisporangium krabiense]MBB5628949.1 anti-sigma B factor antagonist [Sphaerisporangium krabiense]GII60210.1 anti-sigma factor antagonist [Sphaerisporangium krabiense]